MANNPSSRKRAKQSQVRRVRNASERSMLRTYIKKVVNAITAGQKNEAEVAYKAAVPVIDSMVNKGFIHKNKAARHKSRLNLRIHSLN